MTYSEEIKKFREIPLQNRKNKSKFYVDKIPNRLPVLINLP